MGLLSSRDIAHTTWKFCRVRVGVVVVVLQRAAVLWQNLVGFCCGIAAAFALMGMMLFRVRMNRLTRQLSLRSKKRLAERTRIAQELHEHFCRFPEGLDATSRGKRLAGDDARQSASESLLEHAGAGYSRSRNTVQDAVIGLGVPRIWSSIFRIGGASARERPLSGDCWRNSAISGGHCDDVI